MSAHIPTDPQRPYRIAIRAEGSMVNAYWARTETMEGAELVASISRELAESDRAIFDSFRLLMEACSIVLARVRLGAATTVVEVTPAPEHERAGRG